jgi:hypothetical protein
MNHYVENNTTINPDVHADLDLDLNSNLELLPMAVHCPEAFCEIMATRVFYIVQLRSSIVYWMNNQRTSSSRLLSMLNSIRCYLGVEIVEMSSAYSANLRRTRLQEERGKSAMLYRDNQYLSVGFNVLQLENIRMP